MQPDFGCVNHLICEVLSGCNVKAWHAVELIIRDGSASIESENSCSQYAITSESSNPIC